MSAEHEAAAHAELVALEAYKDAGRRYDAESQGGERPLEAGANLRIAAKRWAATERARDALNGGRLPTIINPRPCSKCSAPLEQHFVRVDGHELRCPTIADGPFA